ncbi:MAG: methyltransferase type 11 [Ilumatobacteraceae bacterium]|nr:methyltransferase type 11 [Ilumatobacteraceae bacterium]
MSGVACEHVRMAATPPGTDDHGFPDGFFRRTDETPDGGFYGPPRLVTHIDDRAVAAVGAIYRHLGVDGRVLDLMSSWISHFVTPPRELVVLGMNQAELGANTAATSRVVHDLNIDPTLPFEDGSFDGVTCCVSIDYLTTPIEVFREVQRVLVPGGTFVNTFSNRCFPTKAIHGWLATDDEGHCAIVSEYFRRSGGWQDPEVALLTPPHLHGDPLYAVWARSAPTP